MIEKTKIIEDIYLFIYIYIKIKAEDVVIYLPFDIYNNVFRMTCSILGGTCVSSGNLSGTNAQMQPHTCHVLVSEKKKKKLHHINKR